MDAIQYLIEQHREIESLFEQFESAADPKRRLRIWRHIADLLAVHTALEETILFPAARSAALEGLLGSALAEHLAARQLVAELVEADEVDAGMVAKMSVLRRWNARHACEEETELFPRARALLTTERLDVLGALMARVADHLMGFGAGERIAARIASA